MLKALPEGVRRVNVVVGVLCAICWITFLGVVSDGFDGVGLMGFVVLLVGAVLVYLLPALIYRVFRWIKEGFAMDTNL